MKKTILAIVAVAALALVACENGNKTGKGAPDGAKTEQTDNAATEQAAEGPKGTPNKPGVVAQPATNGPVATPVPKARPVPTAAEMKKMGLTGDISHDVKLVVKTIVDGSMALQNGKDPKEVDKATQELLLSAAAYYESKGKLSEFNELRDEAMKEELGKRLLEQKQNQAK